MADREEFLAALTEDSAFSFNKIMKRHYATGDPFNISEILETLSKDQVSCMWKNLLGLCTTALQGSDFEDAHQQEEELLESLQILQDLSTVANHFVSLDKPMITNELFQIVSVLHGILLSLPDDAAKLQNEIARLCEYWFLADFFGKEELISNTIIYLLARTHLQSPTKADLKRVWNMKNAFHLLDLEDESSDGLKILMQRCLLHPLYLGTDMGKKILAFIFTLHPCVVECFHNSIKNAIPTCQILFLDAFSEIYYQGWKEAESPCKEKIETLCIQDLMYRAVHAKKALFSKIENILMYIHKHKSQGNVDEMLYRLYQPILWRALKASNALVRANAASLLIDAFPLLDTSSGVIENDQQRQMQLDAVAELLQDSCPVVRAIAVQGVCQICFYYWEYIPATTIKDFFTKLTEELAFDSSSSEVRVAVFKGLKFLINDRLTHSLLKSIMPNLRDLIHDSSEKVRRIFLELLLAVKGVRSIKFWSIVPLGHLLARLEVEKSTNCIKIIVKLLINSYLPSKGDPSTQLTNCAELMWTSRGAARTFFKFAHFTASVKVIANFILLITKCLLGSIRNPTGQENSENKAANNDLNETNRAATGDETIPEEPSVLREVANDAEIDFKDKRLLTTMLEVLAISWLGIKRKFDKGGNAKLKEKLINALNEAVPEFLQNFQDGETRAAVITLASHLPQTDLFSESCLDALQNLPANVGPDEFGPVVHYLCATGFAPDVLDHLHLCLQKGLSEPINTHKKISRRKGKGVKNDGQATAVNILAWILSQASTRDVILEHKEKCRKLHELLKSSMDCLEVLVQDTKSDKTKEKALKEKEDFLEECLSLYCRIGIHLYGQKENLFEEDLNIVDDIQYVLNWMERVLLPEIDKYGGSSLEDAASTLIDSNKGKKRSSSDESTQNLGAFMLKLIQNQLILTSEVICLGFGTPSFNEFVADFIDRLSSHASAVYTLPDMMRVSSDISQARSANIEQVSGRLDPVTQILKACFKNIHLFETQFPGHDTTQVLTASKSYFTEIVKSRFCSQAAFSPSNTPIMSTILPTVVDDIRNYLNENENLARFDSQSDLPTIAGFVTTTLLKSKQFQRSLFEELLFFSTESARTDNSTVPSLVYFIDLMTRSGTKNDKNDLLMRTIDEIQKNATTSTENQLIPSAALDLLAEVVKRRTEMTN